MNRNIRWAILFCVAASAWATAEVGDSSAGGFTVKLTYSIQAAPDEVYRRLIHIGDWWDSEHTFSGDAHNLTIEEKAGGCFCEKLPMEAACGTWKYFLSRQARRCGWGAV
jgi:hypothetical protein